MNQNQIAAAISRAIRDNDESVAAFSRRIGMNRPHISSILADIEGWNPSINTLAKMVDGSGLVLIAVTPEQAAKIGANDEL